MKDVSANFFDDFYLQVCTACEDKLLELEWKLEVEKKESNQDVLRTYRQRAYDKIEEFKIIEYSKIQCQYFFRISAIIILFNIPFISSNL